MKIPCEIHRDRQFLYQRGSHGSFICISALFLDGWWCLHLRNSSKINGLWWVFTRFVWSERILAEWKWPVLALERLCECLWVFLDVCEMSMVSPCKPWEQWFLIPDLFSGHATGTDWLEVPTIYRAYFSGLNFRESPHNSYGQTYGTFTYLHLFGSWRSPIDLLVESTGILFVSKCPSFTSWTNEHLLVFECTFAGCRFIADDKLILGLTHFLIYGWRPDCYRVWSVLVL